jgi:hypothetical protein
MDLLAAVEGCLDWPMALFLTSLVGLFAFAAAGSADRNG